ncbi:MAG: ATP-binding protein [Pseudomonadota bacterium]
MDLKTREQKEKQRMNSKSEIRNPKSEIDLRQERINYLRDNTDFVSTLFETLVGYAIIAADFDGNIIAYNEGARQIYGYEPDEIIGKENIEIFFPEDYFGTEKFKHIIKEIIDKERFSYEGEKLRKDGSRFPAQILFTLTKDKEGKMVGLIEIVQDLTERKRMEEKILVSERLSTLGLFSAGISHELRNPLSIIDSSLYYLKTKLKAVDEKVQAHLDRMASSMNMSLAIIDSLHNLAQMKEPQLQRLDLISITLDAIADSKVPGTVDILRNIPEQEVLVNADPGQLKMAFKNIVKNAVQAMKDQGTLEVTIKTMNGQAEISFTDTGPGIAPESLDKIFQPLFSTKARGLGIGLSIVKMIIDKHGGTIEAKSELGKGTTFLVHIPIINPDVAKNPGAF